MTTQRWFQKETAPTKRKALIGRPANSLVPKASELGSLAARLRPHELIAMLTHHYTRVRARSMPRVKTSLSVNTPRGKAAVTISFG
jgi:hypothetical protein